MRVQIIAALALAFTSSISMAKPIPSMPEQEAKISATKVHLSKRIYNDGSTIVRAVVLDHGLSTDMSARYQLLITVNTYGEMLNLGTAFDLGSIYNFEDVFHQNGKKFSISYTDYEPEHAQGMITRLFNIDVTQAVVDAKNERREDFDDGYYSSQIDVESVIPN